MAYSYKLECPYCKIKLRYGWYFAKHIKGHQQRLDVENFCKYCGLYHHIDFEENCGWLTKVELHMKKHEKLGTKCKPKVCKV